MIYQGSLKEAQCSSPRHKRNPLRCIACAVRDAPPQFETNPFYPARAKPNQIIHASFNVAAAEDGGLIITWDPSLFSHLPESEERIRLPQSPSRLREHIKTLSTNAYSKVNPLAPQFLKFTLDTANGTPIMDSSGTNIVSVFPIQRLISHYIPQSDLPLGKTVLYLKHLFPGLPPGRYRLCLFAETARGTQCPIRFQPIVANLARNGNKQIENSTESNTAKLAAAAAVDSVIADSPLNYFSQKKQSESLEDTHSSGTLRRLQLLEQSVPPTNARPSIAPRQLQQNLSEDDIDEEKILQGAPRIVLKATQDITSYVPNQTPNLRVNWQVSNISFLDTEVWWNHQQLHKVVCLIPNSDPMKAPVILAARDVEVQQGVFEGDVTFAGSDLPNGGEISVEFWASARHAVDADGMWVDKLYNVTTYVAEEETRSLAPIDDGAAIPRNSVYTEAGSLMDQDSINNKFYLLNSQGEFDWDELEADSSMLTDLLGIQQPQQQQHSSTISRDFDPRLSAVSRVIDQRHSAVLATSNEAALPSSQKRRNTSASFARSLLVSTRPSNYTSSVLNASTAASRKSLVDVINDAVRNRDDEDGTQALTAHVHTTTSPESTVMEVRPSNSMRLSLADKVKQTRFNEDQLEEHHYPFTSADLIQPAVMRMSMAASQTSTHHMPDAPRLNDDEIMMPPRGPSSDRVSRVSFAGHRSNDDTTSNNENFSRSRAMSVATVLELRGAASRHGSFSDGIPKIERGTPLEFGFVIEGPALQEEGALVVLFDEEGDIVSAAVPSSGELNTSFLEPGEYTLAIRLTRPGNQWLIPENDIEEMRVVIVPRSRSKKRNEEVGDLAGGGSHVSGHKTASSRMRGVRLHGNTPKEDRGRYFLSVLSGNTVAQDEDIRIHWNAPLTRFNEDKIILVDSKGRGLVWIAVPPVEEGAVEGELELNIAAGDVQPGDYSIEYWRQDLYGGLVRFRTAAERVKVIQASGGRAAVEYKRRQSMMMVPTARQSVAELKIAQEIHQEFQQ